MTQSQGPAGIEIRPVESGEFESFHRVFSRALGFPMPSETDMEVRREHFDWDRSLAAFDGDRMIATAHSFPVELTVPGPAQVTAAAVTAVSVSSTHRRRGILTSLMRKQLSEARDRSEPAAILLASESVIYGRFGYGLAAYAMDVEVERDHAQFARPPRAPGRLGLISDDEADKVYPDVFDRFRREQTGAIDRDPNWWSFWTKTRKANEETHVVYESPSGDVDGYARYTVRANWGDGGTPSHRLEIRDLVAVTGEAYEALWHHCLNVDLVDKVSTWARPPHERLRWLLADPRRLRATALRDFLWLRPLDPSALMSSRRYRTPGTVRIELVDTLFEDISGVYELEGSSEGATCVRTSGGADLRMSVADLGAILLGTTAPSELAAVGRIDERSTGALTRADLMFSSSPPPWCNTGF